MIRDTLVVDAGDVRLAVYVSGPRDATPIVLVHGYPDSATVWEPVRAQLDSRYRVISYDVRGAGASEAPAARSGYRLERLAADLAAVTAATCGTRPFHLVGHDWGSIQCWEAVTDPGFQGRIASYTSISGPCLDHAALGLRGDRDQKAAQAGSGSRLKQILKSWYIFFFHLPLIPELVWRLGGARSWPLWLRVTERVRPERDPAQLRNALNGINLYRANFIDRLLHPRARHAHTPVQFIVPMRDRYVGPPLSLGLERWLGPYVRTEIDASHWVVLRDPLLIAADIDSFVAQHAQMDGAVGVVDTVRSATPGGGNAINAQAAGA
ncbi:alpha/beta fold hydrolase [Paraburkholderia megapolitana]|uniref:Pimeloyl-ACP methyl ester carboxylesterase n=1 Tax=Paraburkholderia megapolitana TaxID=420953 RepID=A0A1I3T5Z3_9BURK|nr:alpha/beta fold hydrolase [Paraburkholderia megapolitana]QDQ81395.1 alpha/beta fold hydrolase [Paraburkholderia megapolitana]SFJ64947.1 Pimeloyl-ACP methyl ester carboxylesterase [Paraburkholderia megapolitana]